MGSPFSFLLPIQISYLYKSKVVIVEAGGLLVCHLVGHLFNIARLLLMLKDRTKLSSLLGSPPALPQTESSSPHSGFLEYSAGTACGRLLAVPQYLLLPSSMKKKKRERERTYKIKSTFLPLLTSTYSHVTKAQLISGVPCGSFQEPALKKQLI